LILPPTTPLWQPRSGHQFGVVIAKEVFRRDRMNFINRRWPLARSCSLPIRRDLRRQGVDGGAGRCGRRRLLGATVLSQLRVMTQPVRVGGLLLVRAFFGFEPGSMGETSALAA